MGRRILSAKKAHAGRFSDSKYNPNTLTRMPPTQYPLSGKAAPPPNSRDAFPSLQQGSDPLGWAQGDPREPQDAQGYPRAPSAPLGGDGPTGPVGVIPKPFRMEPRFDWKVFTSRKKAVRMERRFRMDGPSEWKAVPCVHTAAKTPNRISADLVGFGWIRMDLDGFDRLY